MATEATGGASNNERLLAAARSDDQDMLLEIFDEGDFDINHQDGLGNTALHYAAKHGSLDCLDNILEYDGCDVDYVNRIEGATPLHLAIKLEDEDIRIDVVNSLLDAGADITIKDKNGNTVLDILPVDDIVVRPLIRQAQLSARLAQEDVVDDEDEDDEGSGSGSEE